MTEQSQRDELRAGIDLGEAATSILSTDWSTIGLVAATQRIDHIDATKAELRAAVAYLAIQYNRAYRDSSGRDLLDARLALSQIRRALDAYQEQHAEKPL